MYRRHYARASLIPRTTPKPPQKSRPLLPLICGLLLLSCALSNSHASLKASADVQHFKAWQNRLAAGEHGAWRDYLGRLDGKPLLPYLHYLQLNAELSDWSAEQLENAATHERIRAFLDVWPELHISDNLKRQWLRRLGKDQQWLMLLNQQVSKPPVDIQCQRLEALYHSQTPSTRSATLQQAKQLWLAGKSQPNGCDPLFGLLKQENQLNQHDYHRRIRNSFESGNTGFAKWLRKQLPSQQRSATQAWFDLYNQPADLAQLLKQHPSKERQRLARQAMHWLAGSQPEQAAMLWPAFISFAKPDPTQQQKLWRRLALKGARSYHPRAQIWLAQAELKKDDSYAWGWVMRHALNNQDWLALRHLSREKLQLDGNTSAAIAFWGAYAAAQLGQTSNAQQEWQALATQHNWYGYIAADQLQSRYPASQALPKSDPINRKLLFSYQEARRARDLLLTENIWLARGEWAALLKTIPAGLAQEAALVAYEMDWPSMAARTQAVYTQQHVDETLFPRPWQAIVTTAAQQHQIPKAHIWSQMRAESLFMKDARSSVGATGLMQLMPATARNVGRRLQLKNWRRLPLRDPNTNIHLGSRYIAEMLERFDQKIPLAAAAYNAGPHRVDQWLAEREYDNPLLWIEMIPFTETRKYVQRALYFHSRYDKYDHGQPSRISDLLGAPFPLVAQANQP